MRHSVVLYSAALQAEHSTGLWTSTDGQIRRLNVIKSFVKLCNPLLNYWTLASAFELYVLDCCFEFVLNS